MKKIVLFSFLTLAACALTLSGCREKGLQNVRGMVRSVNIHEDTLISMTVNVNESGDTLVFYLDDARFQQGINNSLGIFLGNTCNLHPANELTIITHITPVSHLCILW